VTEKALKAFLYAQGEEMVIFDFSGPVKELRFFSRSAEGFD
jgi:hypothetical protein